tara:strand:- start:990 stop:1172 length:183 start_codon:yes stop_codon:yes gene_type:complete
LELAFVVVAIIIIIIVLSFFLSLLSGGVVVVLESKRYNVWSRERECVVRSVSKAAQKSHI